MKKRRLLSIAVLCTLAYISPAQTIQTLDWSAQSYTAGTLSGQFIINGYPIELTIDDPSNSKAPGTPAIGSFYQGDQPAVDDSFIWASILQSIRTTNSVKLTFTLDTGAGNDGYSNVSFKLFDIDGVSTNTSSVKPRKENVVINGYNGSTLVSPSLTGSSIHTVSGNSVTSDNTDTDITGGNSADGVVTVDFGSTVITKFEIIFSIDQTDPIPLTNRSTPGFSIYDLYFTTNSPLPLSLYNFKVIKKTNGLIRLTWQSDFNDPFTKYLIERSANAVDFNSIGEIIKGELNYLSFQDQPEGFGDIYYRIREEKINGEVNFSGIVHINSDTTITKSANVFPNPVKETFNLYVNDTDTPYRFFLLGSFGKQIKELSPAIKQFNLYTFDVSNVKAGVYYIRIISDDLKQMQVNNRILKI